MDLPNLDTDKLEAALLAAQKDIGALDKGSKNEYSGYSYTSAEDMLTGSRAVLHKHGLLLTRTGWDLSEREGKPATVVSQFKLTHSESKQFSNHQTRFPVVDKKGTPEDKAVAIALTSTLSYFLRDLLMIPRQGEEDMDTRGDRDAKPEKPKTRQKKKVESKPAGEATFDKANLKHKKKLFDGAKERGAFDKDSDITKLDESQIAVMKGLVEKCDGQKLTDIPAIIDKEITDGI